MNETNIKIWVKELEKRGFKIEDINLVKRENYKDNSLETAEIFFRTTENTEECGVLWFTDNSSDSVAIGTGTFLERRTLKHFSKKMEAISELNKIVYSLYKK